jgi:DmsE family decaheme c-type cytochrome
MRRRTLVPSPAAWLIVSGALWLATFAGVKASTVVQSPDGENLAQAPRIPTSARQGVTAAAPQSPTATYVGEDTCLTCHAGQKEGYFDSPHHRAMDPRTPAAAKSCETCHGPGSDHASDPVHNKVKDFQKASSTDINATCTSCHNKGEHALWDGSTHEARGLACTSCHSVHSPKSEKAQLRGRTQMELCATCHRDKVAKLDRSGHMPVREGKMDCTTCHNVHGSTNVKLLRKGDTIAGMCTTCHADKRGPFLWEHAPASEGCTTCHDPHGSQNERMLVAKLPILCQRCHVSTRHPSTIYDSGVLATSNRLFGRSCVTCHAAIHGSNHPAGQFFLR